MRSRGLKDQEIMITKSKSKEKEKKINNERRKGKKGRIVQEVHLVLVISQEINQENVIVKEKDKENGQNRETMVDKIEVKDINIVVIMTKMSSLSTTLAMLSLRKNFRNSLKRIVSMSDE